jgi:hypothetical protein
MAILKLISDSILVNPPEVVSLKVVHAMGDDGSKTPLPELGHEQLLLKFGMEFNCLPGTTIEDLEFAAKLKNRLPIQFAEIGTMWYATARVESFEFDTMFQGDVLRTQNAIFLVTTKPAPTPNWFVRRLSKLK